MRKAAIALIAAIATISVGAVAAPATAAAPQHGSTASAAVRHPIITPVHGGAAPRMGQYSAAQFEREATTLPSALTAQLQKQLGMSGAQFLADGQAAAAASQVITGLRSRGVRVTGSQMHGTALTVYVPTAADAAAAQTVGAIAVVGSQPRSTAALPTFRTDAYTQKTTSPGAGTSPLLGGDGWAYFDGAGGYMAACSVGFLGYSAATSAREFATAGHCADYAAMGDTPPSYDRNGVDGSVYSFFDADANPEDATRSIPVDIAKAHTVGVLKTSAFEFGGGDDYGTVPVTDPSAKPQNAVSTWGGTGTGSNASAGVQNSGAPVAIVGDEAPLSGAPVCHSGDRTGWQCGTILSGQTDVTATFETDAAPQDVDGFLSTIYVCEGDSGGSIVSGQYAVGTLSGGSWAEPSNGTCESKAQSTVLAEREGASASQLYSIGYPLVSPEQGAPSFAQDDPDFVLGVTEPVTAPKLTVDGDGNPTAMSGTLAFANAAPAAPGTPVSLAIDGAAASTTQSAANTSGQQAWQFALSGLAAGAHTYTVTVGTGPSAVSQSGAFDAPITVNQPVISGTAAVGQVLTASATASEHAVLSYQWYDLGLSGDTSTAIPGATAKTLTPTAALARHALAVTVTASELGAGVSAQSAPTAALIGGPVLSSAAITGTAQLGQRLTAVAGGVVPGTTLSYQWKAAGSPIAGATGNTLTLGDAQLDRVITVTIDGSLADYTSASKTSPPTPAVFAATTRVAGTDQYATSVAASETQFRAGASKVFLVSSTDNSDAFSVAPAAAKVGGDVLLTATGTLPASVSTELKRLKPKTVYIIGSTGSISAAVATKVRSVTGVTPQRISGSDRYASNAAIVAKFFPSARSAFVAAGTTSSDALSAASVAAGLKDPLLLVPGASSAPTAPVAAQLSRLKPSTIYVVGATAAVSSAMQSRLAKTGKVTRVSGSNVYATSVAVAAKFHPSSAQAVLASGTNYPYALVGALYAGWHNEPLLTSHSTCVPSGVAIELRSMRASAVTLVGPAAVLGAAVAAGKEC